MKILLYFFILSQLIFSQVDYNKYFENKTLRLDYFHTGDKNNDSYSFDELKSEPYWGGSHKNLLDTFDYGTYKFIVIDEKSDKQIYSHTYSTLFQEWQTTDEATKTIKTFSETVVFPFPKEKVRVEFYTRDKKTNQLKKKFEYKINPQSYFIKSERNLEYQNFQVHYSGDPAKKVDIVILPEGYTAEQMDKFKQDCKKFSGYLLNADPYKENADKINIWGVAAPSKESGTDIPADHIWKKTILNSSFYTFDLDRYVMTSDNKAVRDLAANAPYDQIFILVNTDKYGGGSIYNHYSVCVSDNVYGEYIFTHEFGHGFSFLGDEYYNSEVAYNDFYPLDVEPLEPNLTTLKNFDAKWKNLVDANVPIPTPNEVKYTGKIGAFEGGGYMTKGIYRPSLDCTMKSISVNNFCKVCKNAIIKMINFYSE
ncbi:MAG: M64 family metallopeptidase [Bacteroidota bacterium]|nr:M64 family metallopeptidase [Bacteroidota bacterium]